MTQAPHDLAAEQALVTLALLTRGESFDRVSERIDAGSFYDRTCSMVWSSIARVRAAGDEISEFVVATELAGKVDEGSVLAFTDRALPPKSDDRYARIVAEHAQRRKLMAACDQARTLAMDTDRPHAEVVADAEKAIYEALRTVRRREPWRPMHELIERVKVENAHAAAERGRIIGVQTGLTDLDWHLRGLRPGELVVIGGRTSEGKSALALTVAHNIARRGSRTAYFSCEITGEDLARRLIAGEGVSIQDQESFDYVMVERTRNLLRDAYQEVGRLPIEVVYQPKITIPQIRTWCRRFLTAGRLDVIVVDYLALLGSHEKTERRDREIAGFTGACLELAAEFECPVIAIQGLNRKSAGDGKLIRPEISHLMDSSAIEYDAHKILLVHNPNAKIDGDDGDDSGEREIIVAKNRSGKRNRTVKVRYLGAKFLFVDDARGMVPPKEIEDAEF